MSSHGRGREEQFKEYLAALDTLVEYRGRSIKICEDEPFWLVVFDDVPEKGSKTAFTFGISFVRHPSWQSGVPEIVISVNSSDDDWLLSLGAIASCLRGICPFSYGDVLRFGKALSQESEMSSYFIFWPTILDKEQQQLVLPNSTITFKQAYPIFEAEADAIAMIGAENFFMKEGVDFSDVSRNKAV